VEKERFQGYVASLEQILKNTHFDLKEAMDQFQDLCHRVSPEKIVPLETITDIRQTYKEIQDHLTKISGIKQLLEGKYRQYYRRDWLREREITEFSFLAKSLHLKLECD
jgi:ubiquinone biosynthesis protein Coq4